MSVQLQRAVPRHIIFCVDVSGEMNETICPTIDGGVHQNLKEASSRLDTVILLIKRYIATNRILAPKDTYAIVGMMEKAYWMMNFTSEPRVIHKNLASLVTHEHCSTFDTDSLYRVISENAALNNDVHNRLVHAIVFYGRTDVMPQPLGQDYAWIRNCSNFAFDLMFLHGPARDSELCQAVYDFWVNIEPHVVSSWYFEFSKLGRSSMTKAMAQLTAHPLQRGDQERINDLVTSEMKRPETIYLSD
ncbi:hypothetical protein BDB00DRAFT_848036 [Zychaea mexicana]|uniref:uncharacterized protein n=1 Tax=Zychaea mexicana TaxID=64656 RepID=UPI0022FDB23E|nr:uncharacterized protein BDB00DRAFT_848036 [Zychaea mexicana]KAI9488432.1 hypothetical protein BDB00DRAFT_848036 [Zychaea mexicana]